MATITAVFAEIQRRVSDYMGFGLAAPTAGTDEEIRVNDSIRTGLRRFYHCGHPWKFLFPVASVVTSAPYSTGTITVVPGGSGSVVTGAGGASFAATIDEQWRLRTGGDDYDVDSWVSSTQLLLVDTDVTVAAGSGYELGRPYYDLPSDFAGLHGRQEFTYTPGKSDLYGPIPVVSQLGLRRKEQDWAWTYQPIEAALRPKTLDSPSGSQIWQVQFWPVPDARYTLHYQYVHDPEMLDETNINHWGGTPYSEAIILSCLAAAEEQVNDGSTLMHDRFEAALARAIRHDQTATGADRLGPWYDNSTEHFDLPTREELLVDYRMNVPTVEGV